MSNVSVTNSSNIVIISDSFQGKKRMQNQDDILILHRDNFCLLLLFDGVSSLNESINFIQGCKDFVYRNYNDYFDNEIKLSQLIYDMHVNSLNSKFNGKTTCSCLLLHFILNKAFWVNIGDSRIYAFSPSYLEMQTKDDNYNTYFLSKYIGMPDLSIDDVVQNEIDISQNFLICTDGFYKLMENNLRAYFNIFQYKRGINIKKAIKREQKDKNNDDSTYIIVKWDSNQNKN